MVSQGFMTSVYQKTGLGEGGRVSLSGVHRDLTAASGRLTV